MLLPLNELQGEFRGLVGKSVLGQQLQTGKMNVPSISSTLKDTGVVEFSLEETGEANVRKEQSYDNEENSNSEGKKALELKASTDYSKCDITIHEPPKETYDTSL